MTDRAGALSPVDRARIRAAFPGRGLSVDSGVDRKGHFDPPPATGDGAALKAAAVLVPIVDRPDGLTVMLTRRTDHLKAHSGQIAFPGGRVEPDDRSAEHTALRETEEEVGLPEAHIELVGRLGIRETGTGYRVVPVVGLITPPFAVVPDPIEVAEVFEVPLDYLIEPANHRFETRVRGSVERQFYAIPYADYFIWGLTARLLVNLSGVLLKR